jgi:zinc protease
MQNKLVTQSELDNARQYEIRSIPVSVSSVERISRELLTFAWKGQPLDEPMVAAKHYLDMTAQQVQDAFRKYMKPSNLTQAVEGPAPDKH